ncbi:MAG: type IV pilus secretin PilQ, partial [Deltaproteobacteria bacterium]
PAKDTALSVAPASLDSALPIVTPTSTAAPKPEVMGEINQNVAAEKAAHVISASLAPIGEAAAQGSAGSAPAAPQYTGEPISLNLKDVDLKDFFRLIHEISGLNIIVDPNVTGSVTMVLENVPWDQALDIVLKNNQLGKTLEGNVLRIARLSTLTAEQADAAKLVAAREDAQPLVTKFMPVNYAKASTLASLLKSWVGGGALSKRGNVLVDDRTNTLIVSDIASQIPVIETIVQKLDTKTKQVAIEARVERVSHDFTRTIGNALQLAFTNASGRTQYGGASGANSSGSASATTFSPNPQGQIGLTTPVASGFGAFAISNAGARYIINDVIAAEELTDNAKLISKPMIVTQNNVPGDIIQGLEIPVQTNVNNTVTITYVQASLQMTVTPQITADGNVFLVIKVLDNTPGAAIIGSPGLPINQQSATTQVLVPDGGTVIFGGVTVNQADNSADYVPVLGKIPILGNLFKASTRKTNDLELLFFVTPKILQG